MALYKFSHWEDGSTNPTRTITVKSDMTIIATYELVKRSVTYESTPIAVEATIDTTPIPSGGTIEVPDGAAITITVPAQVEA
jgi:hypothetical protein